MKSFLSKNTNNIINLQLSKLEVEVLLSILSFSEKTANFLLEQEKKSGSAAGISRMGQILADSKDLSSIISMSIDIGEPISDEIH